MSYSYEALLPGTIRLLRLLPHEDENASIQCQLFSYNLQELGKRRHPYDALSYVWGDLINHKSISIDNHNISVTVNLHRALSRLRHRYIERILWVDAVCINQGNASEKEQQIRIMAKIYAQANRVVVWLGEGADNSDHALEVIRVAGGGRKSSKSLNHETIHKAVLALLQRAWFRRIWVLQEVAAARHILIMCGSAEIDGYAFCSGVSSLNFYEADLDLQSLIRSVTYLIRGAIFRPSYAASGEGRFSLDICPLGELIDMYHTHEATMLHDKVFALLGMSSDDFSKASWSINYGAPWEDLFHNLVRFFLHDNISIRTLGNKQAALIESRGCVLGKVYPKQSQIAWGDSQGVDVNFEMMSGGPEYPWTLHASAKPIQDGDIVCLLHGASKPSIIRLCNGCFYIILITVTPPETILPYLQSRKAFTSSRSFSLIWDWEKLPREWQDPKEYENWLNTNHQASKIPNMEFNDPLKRATRRWNLATILDDLEEYEAAQTNVQKAIAGYEKSAANGSEAIVKQLLESGEVEVNCKHEDGTSQLWWAAKGGHYIIVKLLLGTGKVDVNPKQKDGTTPLWWAAKGGHDNIVKLLLRTGEVDDGVKDENGITPIQAAAGAGHLAVVERLLQARANINAEAGHEGGRTALQAAAEGGYLVIVERLLQEKADVNAAAAKYNGRTALQAAAEGGYLAIVERLLQENADINAEAGYFEGRTALQAAAEGGHLAIVERLLQEGADINAESGSIGGRSALQAAAGEGHLAIIKRLIQEKADINAEAGFGRGRTALQAAAEGGYLVIVERLLQEKADVNAAAATYDGRTALDAAAEGGHLSIVERLLQEGADTNAEAGLVEERQR